MNDEKDSIQTALSVADALWPAFVLVDDHIFFAWTAPDSVNMEQWRDSTEVESFLNHTHVLDLFGHDASIEHDPWMNKDHPDFLAACQFGLVWAETISTKLAKDFPERQFFVYYTAEDDPIVRFHQEHTGETPWLIAEDWQAEIEAGSVVIHRVCGCENTLKPSDSGCG